MPTPLARSRPSTVDVLPRTSQLSDGTTEIEITQLVSGSTRHCFQSLATVWFRRAVTEMHLHCKMVADVMRKRITCSLSHSTGQSVAAQ